MANPEGKFIPEPANRVATAPPKLSPPPLPPPPAVGTNAHQEAVQKLLSLFGKKVSNLYFRNQKVYLDGYIFENCCFESCELHTISGGFIFRSCRIIACQPFFGPNPLKVVRMFNTFFNGSVAPVYNGTFDSNGLITIE